MVLLDRGVRVARDKGYNVEGSKEGGEDESPIEQVVPRRRATSRQGNIVVRPIYVCLIF
jgi:hypothetical protein